MKSAMFLLGLVLLASTVEHAAAFGYVSKAIADTHAAIEDHISSKLLKKVEVSGPREVEVSGPRDVEISGIREVEKAPEKHSLHSMIPDLGYEYEGTDGIASAFAGTDTGY